MITTFIIKYLMYNNFIEKKKKIKEKKYKKKKLKKFLDIILLGYI